MDGLGRFWWKISKTSKGKQKPQARQQQKQKYGTDSFCDAVLHLCTSLEETSESAKSELNSRMDAD